MCKLGLYWVHHHSSCVVDLLKLYTFFCLLENFPLLERQIWDTACSNQHLKIYLKLHRRTEVVLKLGWKFSTSKNECEKKVTILEQKSTFLSSVHLAVLAHCTQKSSLSFILCVCAHSYTHQPPRRARKGESTWWF